MSEDVQDLPAVGSVIMASVQVGRGGHKRLACRVLEVKAVDLGADRPPLLVAIGNFRKRDGTWSAVQRALGRPWQPLPEGGT